MRKRISSTLFTCEPYIGVVKKVGSANIQSLLMAHVRVRTQTMHREIFS